MGLAYQAWGWSVSTRKHAHTFGPDILVPAAGSHMQADRFSRNHSREKNMADGSTAFIGLHLTASATAFLDVRENVHQSCCLHSNGWISGNVGLACRPRLGYEWGPPIEHLRRPRDLVLQSRPCMDERYRMCVKFIRDLGVNRADLMQLSTSLSFNTA